LFPICCCPLPIPVENGGRRATDEVSTNPLVAVQEESCVCVLRRPALTPNIERTNTLKYRIELNI